MKTELLDAHLTGDLERDQAAFVESALRNDEELREVYFQQMRMDAALKVLFTGEADVSSAEFASGVVARLEMEGVDGNREFSKSVLTEILEEKEKIVPLRWPDLLKSAAVAAVAAVVAISAMQTVNWGKDNSVPSLTEENRKKSSYLARIQSTKNAVWGTIGNSEIREDGWISNGMVDLKDGVAEIAFNSGARAFVEGPARLSVESNNRIFLQKGKITAEVASEASGFTVNTPRMNIVDIGTRFGVSVAKNGETELHVMQGVVEASRSSGNAVSIRVREGLALKADSRPLSALEPIPYGGDRFSLTAGVWQDASPVIHYEFDESGGAELLDTGNLQKGGPYDLSLLGEFDAKPRRAPGLSGGCLVFEGSRTLSTPLSQDFLLEKPFTIAFWMKIPPRIGREADDYVIGWGNEQAGWEFGCRNADGGGALIVRNAGSMITGTTDLADGKWHHIVARFIGGESVEMATHIHLYVDGHQERITSWSGGGTSVGTVGELRIGDLRKSGFPGWLDRISIYDEAISTRSIQRLFKK
ncbi:MAG: FecR domain-containing protein [Verrucomicrobiales bacterium]|nr:FecR domain-containing protein [Verrucomicrobiales bacterium]